MTYKGFLRWANDRACDGRWGIYEAMACTHLATCLSSAPWFRREKLWKEMKGDEFVNQIVVPINAHYLICDKYH